MAYQYPLNGGRINASMSGNTVGAHTLVSTGTLVLSGGNNITLSQNGNTIGISAANASSGSINFSAGTTSSNLNSVVFSNSGGVSFGLNGGTITGTVATNYAASNHSHGNPTLNLSNLSGTTASASNGLTLSLSAPQVSSLSADGIISISNSGNTISIGAPAVSMGVSNMGNTAGVSGTASNQLIFAGGNNITLSQSTDVGGNTLTISGPNIPAQTAYSFAGSNGVSFGTNGSTVTASVATDYAVSSHSHGNPTLNLTNLSGTTASNSGGLTLSLSAAAPGGGVALSAGTQSASAGTINFANSNGITFGMSGSSQITASHNGITSQSVQTAGGYITGNTIGQSSASTLDARSLSLSALGGASAGFSDGMLQVSAPPVSSLSGVGAVSLSSDSNMIYISAPAFSAGMSNAGNTAGTSGTASNQLILAGGSGITLSQSTGAGGNTISIAGPNALTSQSDQVLSASNGSFAFQTAGFSNANGVTFGTSAGSVMTASVNTSYAASNHSHGNPTLALTNLSGSTASASNGLTISLSAAAGGGGGSGIVLANSQTTYSSGTVNLNASGALTIGSTTGQQLNFSVPAISMLSAGAGISISTNDSTIVLQADGGYIRSYYNPQDAYPLAAGQHGNGSLHIQPMQAPSFQFDRIALPMILSNNAGSSGSQTVSFHVGIFTRNAGTLSLASSTSSSFAMTQSGTQGSYSLYGGQRIFTIGSTNTIPQGQYYVGILSQTASGGANASVSQLVASQINTNFSGVFGVASATSAQQTRGLGYYATSTTAMPASIAFSQIQGTASMALRQPAIYFVSQTF